MMTKAEFYKRCAEIDHSAPPEVRELTVGQLDEWFTLRDERAERLEKLREAAEYLSAVHYT